jgi:ABC-type multidrug transport system fused ATPase/permease subunit
MMKHAPALVGLFRLIRRSLGPYAWRVAFVVALIALSSAETLLLPRLFGDIINNGVVKGDTSYIWRTGSLMLGVTILICITGTIATRLGAPVTVKVGADLRAAIYRQVQAFSTLEVNRFGAASLGMRSTHDADQVEMLVGMGLSVGVSAIVFTVGGVLLAIWESAPLSLLFVIFVPFICVVIVVLGLRTVPMMQLLYVRSEQVNQVLAEQVTGVRVIRAFGRQRIEQDRFRAVNADLARDGMRSHRTYVVGVSVMTIALSMSGAAVVWYGGHLITHGDLAIGNMVAFLTYIAQILVGLVTATAIVVQLPRAVDSATRIGQVLDADPAISDPADPVTPAVVDGAVEFSHVTFGYPGSENPVVRDLTFTVPSGRTTAIIGSIGSGKSTLINLIPRFTDPTDGTVHVNGTDIRDQSAERLWSTIGLVPQRPFLFRGTIATNLRFGAPDATDDQLWHALDIAQATDFVTAMPGQLDTPIDQGGTNISTGQRQRLCIARALVRQPSLYLFDDCFSALDAATDAHLRAALADATDGATVITVAQRLTSIMHADQIIVLDAGTITGIGTHDQLLTDCAAYREIAISQLGEEIAA